MITSGNELIISYDPKTGMELWRTKGHASNAIATPLAGNGMVFVYAGFPVKKTIAITLGASAISAIARHCLAIRKGTAYVLLRICTANISTCVGSGNYYLPEAKTGKIIYEGGRVRYPRRSPLPVASTARFC